MKGVNRMKKLISVVLSFILLASILASCGESGETGTSSSASEISNEASVPEASEEISEEVSEVYVPDIYSGRDYDGRTFTVWTTYSTSTNTSSILPNEPGTYEENFSDKCNTAIKDRNAKIKETLGVTIDEIYYYSPTRYGSDSLAKIRSFINANDPTISAYACCLYDCGTLALEGSFYDLNSFENFNSENPWWQQYFNENVSLNGKLYFTIGDIDYNSYSRIPCVVYNDRLIKELNLENPVTLAKEGKWTIDKAIEYSKTFCEDITDPIGVDLFDKFGWGGNVDDLYSMTYGAGIRILSKNGDGFPELTLYTEDTVDFVDKLMDFTRDDTYVCVNDFFNISNNPGGLLYEAFQEGRCLMFGGSLRACSVLNMDDPFGIVPEPKANEEQEYYYSLLNTWTTNAYSIGVNLTEEDAEFAAAMLDVLGYYSWKEYPDSFINNYYTVMLKNQKLSLEDSEAMLDLIFSVRGCEPGSIYQIGKYGAGITVNDIYVNMRAGVLPGFKASYEKYASGIEKDVENLVNKMISLG